MTIDWISVKLSSLGTVVGGATPSTKNPDYYGGNISWLTPKDLTSYRFRIISEGERSITDLGYNSCSTKMVPSGTILYTSRAPIGLVAIAGCDLCTNQGFKSIIPDIDAVDPLFLFYLMKKITPKLQFEGNGSTFSEISKEFLEDTVVTIPSSIEDQRKIASFLCYFDDLIENYYRLNDSIMDLVATLFNNVCQNVTSNYSKLGDLCSFISRGVTPNYVKKSNYRVLGQTCVRDHLVLIGNSRPLKVKDFGEKIVKQWDILVNSTGVGSLGRVAQLGYEYTDVVVDSHITIVRPFAKYRAYLGCLLTSMEAEIENMAEGSTGQTELSRDKLVDLEVPLPDDSDLELFSSKYYALMESVYYNMQMIDNIISLRDYYLRLSFKEDFDLSRLNVPNYDMEVFYH